MRSLLWLDGGWKCPLFITEIPDGGKLNLPANFFATYDGSVNGKHAGLSLLRGGWKSSWYFGTLVPRGRNAE
jgi:hypothetical protein